MCITYIESGLKLSINQSTQNLMVNILDPDETAQMSCLIRIYTVYYNNSYGLLSWKGWIHISPESMHNTLCLTANSIYNLISQITSGWGEGVDKYFKYKKSTITPSLIIWKII